MVELRTHSPHSDLGQTDSPHMRLVWDKEKSAAEEFHLGHTLHGSPIPEIRVKFAIEKRQPSGWSIC